MRNLFFDAVDDLLSGDESIFIDWADVKKPFDATPGKEAALLMNDVKEFLWYASSCYGFDDMSQYDPPNNSERSKSFRRYLAVLDDCGFRHIAKGAKAILQNEGWNAFRYMY